MQDFFQTFWEILVQNRTRLIFILLSSLVLHVLFKRFIEATTKFVFVAIRSFFLKDIKLFYDYRWQKARCIPDAELYIHYHKHLELIHNHDLDNGTNHFDQAIKNSMVKKALHILFNLFYLKDSYNHLMYDNDYFFDLKEMSYATFVYRYNFKHYGLSYKQIEGVDKLEQSIQNLLNKKQLLVLQKRIYFTFFIDFCGIYFKWLWIVLKLNWKAFTICFDNSVLREIDKKLNSFFSHSRVWGARFNLKPLLMKSPFYYVPLNFPFNMFDEIYGEEKLLEFKNEIDALSEKNLSVVLPLYEYDQEGRKFIDYHKFNHQNFIHSFQTDSYDDSKQVSYGIVTQKIIKEEIKRLQKKGKDIFFIKNSLVNRKNINAFVSDENQAVKWHYNFKTFQTEFSFKYILINKENWDVFMELLNFLKELWDPIGKEDRMDQRRYDNSSNILANTIKGDKINGWYKNYFNNLGNNSLLKFSIMKKSWFFNSSNRIFDKYLNSVGFLLFFLIAFVLEEIYSEPVISFIEKTTSFISSLF